VRLKDSTSHSKLKDERFHLASIIVVVLLSLIAWKIESNAIRAEHTSDMPIVISMLEEMSLDGEDEEKRCEILEEIKETAYVSSPVFKYPKLILTRDYDFAFEKSHAKPQAPSNNSINLNEVDSATLESLPVFGPILSGRAIKFRNALGGFISVQQLLDVFGFNEEHYSKVHKWFYIQEDDIVKICVNSASWSDLKRHPYIGYDGARIIDRYRTHNQIYELSQLKALPNMSDSTWSRWVPYLKICNLD
jgi:DNA uptake protein ComE-like DNA-binding protein